MLVSRLIVWVIAASLGATAAAWAQSTNPLGKAAQITQLGNCFPTQTTGAITPSITVTCLTSVVNSYQQYPAVNPQTGTSYTVQTTDYGQLVTVKNSGAIAVTLPGAAAAGFFPFNFYIANEGSGAATITPQGGSQINGASTLVLTTNNSALIVSDGTNYWTVSGTAGSVVSSITVGTTTITSGTTNGLLYDNGGVFGNLSTANNGVLITSNSGVPSISTTLPSGLTVPSPAITGTPTGVGSSITINSTNCPLAGSCTINTSIAIGQSISGGTSNGLLYDNGGLLGNLATGNSGVLVTSSGGVPSIATTIPATTQANITGTGTLTSGATGSGFTLALGSSTVTGTLPLANGGANAAITAAAGGVVYSTASALAVTAAGTLNQCLLSNGSSAPAFGNCNAGSPGVASLGNTGGTDTSLTIAGTGSGPWTGTVTAKLNLGNAQTWTAAQTFTNSDILLLGSSTGYTTFTSANASGSNYTLTFPAVTDTLAVLGTSQTYTATVTNSGTANFTGTFKVASNTMTFPGAAATLPQTVASGTIALATGAVASGACTSAQTSTATGAASTDVIEATFNADPTSTTGYSPTTNGMLTIVSYPTTNTANFKVCNNTGSSITPGAATLNWRITR